MHTDIDIFILGYKIQAISLKIYVAQAWEGSNFAILVFSEVVIDRLILASANNDSR